LGRISLHHRYTESLPTNSPEYTSEIIWETSSIHHTAVERKEARNERLRPESGLDFYSQSGSQKIILCSLRAGRMYSIQEELRYRNVKRFQGGLEFKAHGLLSHSTLGLRVFKTRKKKMGCT
jgi:hypothetical protein